MKRWRSTIAGAFLLGLYDAMIQQGCLSCGRTSDDDQDWNEAYDLGANAGECIYQRGFALWLDVMTYR